MASFHMCLKPDVGGASLGEDEDTVVSVAPESGVSGSDVDICEERPTAVCRVWPCGNEARGGGVEGFRDEDTVVSLGDGVSVSSGRGADEDEL